MTLTDTVARLLVDLVAIWLLAYVVYFRRHRRRDLMLAYVALNLGLFVVVGVLVSIELDLALGFGLFALLSIIRLRSDTVTQEEVAYYFVALVLGLVNGLDLGTWWVAPLGSALLVAAMYVVDHRRVVQGARRCLVTLDRVYADPDELVADLEQRLAGRVRRHVVTEIDFVRDITVVDVRYTRRSRPLRTTP